MDFKDIWDVQSAMKILEHETVDSKLWAEAVEWLILYGPPEIQKMLLDASSAATSATFPELQPSHYTKSGEPVYDITALAQTLGISEDDVVKILDEKKLQQSQFFSSNNSGDTVH